MVKAFRLGSCRRPAAGIESAERIQCDIVHVKIHLLYAALKQGPDKVVIGRVVSLKPSGKHFREHGSSFKIGNFQMVPWLQ